MSAPSGSNESYNLRAEQRNQRVTIYEQQLIGPTTTIVTVTHLYYTHGEVMSQNLWPRYARHFVGITWHIVWSSGAKIYRVI